MDPQPLLAFVRARTDEIPEPESRPARALLLLWGVWSASIDRIPVPFAQGKLDGLRVALIAEASRWRGHVDFDEKWLEAEGLDDIL